MKNRVKSFSRGDFRDVESELKEFLEKNKNIKVTAMSMTFDSVFDWFHVLLTYEESK